jgi:multimeric flavodoxin WrbA
MDIIAFNGSPRKKWNTSILLSKALEGAASKGANTKTIHLYDLNYKGCSSCFECKRINGKSYGKCAIKDDLTAILDSINDVDAIILGSPNYIGSVSGEMKSFFERLTFPYNVYEKKMSSLFNKKIKTGFIYTMGSSDDWMQKMNYGQTAIFIENVLKGIFGNSESLIVNDTYQFDDYSKYVSTRFDPNGKEKRRNNVFPKDCQNAFDMGIRLVT